LYLTSFRHRKELVEIADLCEMFPPFSKYATQWNYPI